MSNSENEIGFWDDKKVMEGWSLDLNYNYPEISDFLLKEKFTILDYDPKLQAFIIINKTGYEFEYYTCNI